MKLFKGISDTIKRNKALQNYEVEPKVAFDRLLRKVEEKTALRKERYYDNQHIESIEAYIKADYYFYLSRWVTTMMYDPKEIERNLSLRLLLQAPTIYSKCFKSTNNSQVEDGFTAQYFRLLEINRDEFLKVYKLTAIPLELKKQYSEIIKYRERVKENVVLKDVLYKLENETIDSYFEQELLPILK